MGLGETKTLWRKRWDSNPRTGEPVRVSNPVQLATMRRFLWANSELYQACLCNGKTTVTCQSDLVWSSLLVLLNSNSKKEIIMTENPNTNLPLEERGTRKSNLLVGIGIVVVVAIVAFVMIQASSLGSNPSEESMEADHEEMMMEETEVTPAESMTENEASDESMMMEESGVVEITMEAGSFYYTPNSITVHQGDTVRIVMNAVDMMHDFVIDELDVKSPVIRSGESTTIEFVADQVGEFEFYCSVGSHRQLGMVGTLIVEQ